MTVPYFYIIKDTVNGIYYAGSRCAKDCNPEELLVTYFTSSKLIKNLIKTHGKTRFKVVKTVPKQDPELYETRFLTKVDARNSHNFYNQHNNVDAGFKNSDMISVKDSNGVYYRVNKNDPRIGNTLTGVNAGRKLTYQEKTIRGHGEVTIEGTTYPSISSAAKALNVDRKRIVNYVSTGEFLLPRKGKSTKVIIGGIEYNTMQSAAESLKVSINAIRIFLKNGKFSAYTVGLYPQLKIYPHECETYTCNICGREVKRKTNLTQHVRKCRRIYNV